MPGKSRRAGGSGSGGSGGHGHHHHSRGPRHRHRGRHRQEPNRPGEKDVLTLHAVPHKVVCQCSQPPKIAFSNISHSITWQKDLLGIKKALLVYTESYHLVIVPQKVVPRLLRAPQKPCFYYSGGNNGF